MKSANAERGFTLLEVIVAVTILSLGMVAILGSQAGLFSGAQRARHMTMTAGLMRCKMTEIEEKLLRLGYQLTDVHDEGECCAEEGSTDYQCAWKIERVELPNYTESLDGGMPDNSQMGPLSAISAFGKSASSSGLNLKGGGQQQLSDLAGQFTSSSNGTSGIASMLMGFVYPSVKPMLEASIRKITVTITWIEGKKKQEFSVVQYVTDPQQGQLMPADMLGIGQGQGSPLGTGLPGTTGTTGTTGTGTTGTGTTGTGTTTRGGN